jgi:hypothetical protein
VGRQMVSLVERGLRGVARPDIWAAAYGLTVAQWTCAQQAGRDLVRQHVAARTQRSRRDRTRRGTS